MFAIYDTEKGSFLPKTATKSAHAANKKAAELNASQPNKHRYLVQIFNN
jgi:hypothetical protein